MIMFSRCDDYLTLEGAVLLARLSMMAGFARGLGLLII